MPRYSVQIKTTDGKTLNRVIENDYKENINLIMQRQERKFINVGKDEFINQDNIISYKIIGDEEELNREKEENDRETYEALNNVKW